MNYSEKLKTLEISLERKKAQVEAKQQSISEAVSQKTKLENDCLEKFKISLSEVPDKIKELESALESGYKELVEEVERIDDEFKSIGC